MKQLVVFVGLVCLLVCLSVTHGGAHGSATAVTWNREVSRIVFEKCASCHNPNGTAFSMLTYLDVQPRANEIKDAVLSRRMPPWGAIKGFGTFRNDQSLSQEQIEILTRWVDGGIRRGNNPQMLPKPPDLTPKPVVPLEPTVVVRGTTRVESSPSARWRDSGGRARRGLRPRDRHAAEWPGRTVGLAARLRRSLSTSIPLSPSDHAARRDHHSRLACGSRSRTHLPLSVDS